ncbi:unnamed protein product [Brassica rapa subsp. narinosa]
MDGHYRPLIYMRPLAIRGVQWALSLQKAILDTPKINMMARVHMSPVSRIFSHNSKVIIQINNQPFVLCHGCFIQIVIYADGSICLDILQNQWSPIYDVAAILTSIQSSPANSEAARIYSENKREYNRKVCDVVEQSWTATSSS